MLDNNRNHALDGVRGLAALAVIFYHSILVESSLVRSVLAVPVQNLASMRDVLTKIALSASHGITAVILFFVLSGLVLRISLDRTRGSTIAVIYNFIVRRLCRLFPALFFALAFCFFVSSLWRASGLPGADLRQFVAASNIWSAVQNALLIKIGVHGASWTIQTEFVAIPFVLIVFFISRLGGIVASFMCLAYSVFAMGTPWMVGTWGKMSWFLPAFISGMLLADPRLKVVLNPVRPVLLWAVFGALIAVRLFLPPSGVAEYAGNIFLSALFVGCVFYSAPDSGMIKVLTSRPVQFLGRISYSLYLVNVPIIWVFMALTPALGLDSLGALERGLVIGLLVTLLSLPVAVFSEKYVERGGIRLGRLLSFRAGEHARIPMATAGLQAVK